MPDHASLSRACGCATRHRARWTICSLTALADVFYPRIFLRRTRRVPVGTVSMTVYFHADEGTMRATAAAAMCWARRMRACFWGRFPRPECRFVEHGWPVARH
jgi:hypothetical protein